MPRLGHSPNSTRRGKAVAKLVSAAPTFDRDQARRVARDLLEARRGVTLGPEVRLKDLGGDRRAGAQGRRTRLSGLAWCAERPPDGFGVGPVLETSVLLHA